MTDQEYWIVRKKQKLEKLIADVNLAIMVKRGEDEYDEGTPEEQQKRADESIMEGERYIAKMFFGGDEHFELIRKLSKDYRLVGGESLLRFSKYASIMEKIYFNVDRLKSLEGEVINARGEYDEAKRVFAAAEEKLARVKERLSVHSDIVDKAKAEREEELIRLGMAGADGVGDGAGADGAGDGAGE